MIGVRDAGALRRATEIRLRGTNGIASPVERIMARTLDGLAEVYRRGIRPSASPATVLGYGNPTKATTTSTTTVSASGGTPPYTHAWTVDAPLTVTSPAGATTAFRAPPGFNGTVFGTDTVRDSTGLSAQVSVGITILDGGDRFNA